MHFGRRCLHGCACMWKEVEDESCDIVPMPALRLQTRSLGLCCLYSPGFAAGNGKPNGSEPWEISKNAFQKSTNNCFVFFFYMWRPALNPWSSSTLYSSENYNFSLLHVSQSEIDKAFQIQLPTKGN